MVRCISWSHSKLFFMQVLPRGYRPPQTRHHHRCVQRRPRKRNLCAGSERLVSRMPARPRPEPRPDTLSPRHTLFAGASARHGYSSGNLLYAAHTLSTARGAGCHCVHHNNLRAVASPCCAKRRKGVRCITSAHGRSGTASTTFPGLSSVALH